MSIFVHCNKCYSRYTNQVKFFITNCSHVYCGKCSDQLKQAGACPLCGAERPALLQLSNDMPESVRVLFSSFKTTMQKTQSIVAFQMDNCLSLLKHMISKYEQLKKEAQKMNDTCTMLKSEVKRLKQELLLRQSSVRRSNYEMSTPAMRGATASECSSFNDMSFSSIHNQNSAARFPHGQNYGYPGHVQRVYQERIARPVTCREGERIRPSSYHRVPTHLSSGGSRSTNTLPSMKDLSLLGSVQRHNTEPFKIRHHNF